MVGHRGKAFALSILATTIFLVAGCSAFSPQPPAAKQLVKVRVGGQSSASDVPYFIGIDKGYFKEEGLDVEYVNFSNAAEMIPALATNQLEVAAIAMSPATLNAVARGIEIKVVADRGSIPAGRGYVAIVVRKDLYDAGKVKDFKDLKGLNIAIQPPLDATANAIQIDKALKLGGLTDRDVTLTPMSQQDMPAALAGKSIEVAVAVEPTITNMAKNGLAVRWKGMDEIYPGQQIVSLTYSPGLTKNSPEAAKAFMVGLLKSMRDFNDAYDKGKNKREIAEIIAKYTSVKDLDVIEKMVPPGMNPDGYLNVQTIKDDQEWFFAKGKITDKVNIDAIVDRQYVDYALQKLGKYQK